MKAKLFRKYLDDELYLIWKTLEKKDYKKLIVDMKKEDFKQIIFSTDLLIQFLNTLYEKGGTLLSVEFTDNIDEENQEFIKNQLINLRSEEINLTEFIECFTWIIDDQSIDINFVYVKNKNGEKFYMYSNGIFEGENLQGFFEEILEESIKKEL